MKKFLALVLVGVMTFSYAAFAAPSPSAQAVSATTEDSLTTFFRQAAAEAGMSEQEYSNNSVVEIKGIEDVAPMGIPTGVYVDGKKINYSIRIFKLSKADIEAVKAFAGKRKILNTFGIKNRYKQNIQASFYSPRIKAGDKVSVYQMVGKELVKLTSSVRDDHVDVVLQGTGYVVVLAE